MGLFLIAIRQLKFLVVGIDYFTKWVEVEALATITDNNVRNFVWRNFIYRYSIPRVLVLDNGKQFYNDAFRDLLTARDQESLLITRPPLGQWAS